MKTAEEIVEEIRYTVGDGLDDIGEIEEIIANAIHEIRKDQDKITRHDCAENIKKMEKEDIESYQKSRISAYQMGYSGDSFIKTSKAHSVIMNTNAIKEDK